MQAKSSVQTMLTIVEEYYDDDDGYDPYHLIQLSDGSSWIILASDGIYPRKDMNVIKVKLDDSSTEYQQGYRFALVFINSKGHASGIVLRHSENSKY